MIPRDMVNKEDYDRMERGLKPRPKKKMVMPEPDPPIVENQIKLTDIPREKFVDLAGVRRRTVTNAEGVSFIGYDVSIDLEDGKRIEGWFDEKNYYDFKRAFKNKIDGKIKEVW